MKGSGRLAWEPTRAAIRAWKDIPCTRSISGAGAILPRTLMLRYLREHTVYSSMNKLPRRLDVSHEVGKPRACTISGATVHNLGYSIARPHPTHRSPPSRPLRRVLAPPSRG